MFRSLVCRVLGLGDLEKQVNELASELAEIREHNAALGSAIITVSDNMMILAHHVEALANGYVEVPVTFLEEEIDDSDFIN